MKSSSLLLVALAFAACAPKTPPLPPEAPRLALHRALPVQQPVALDGLAQESCWQTAAWYPIDQLWLGAPVSAIDCSGRFKVAYSDSLLYIFAEIVDDTLVDTHPDPHGAYWDDDCLEIFVDADHSGGQHQFTHNAFAYHVALNGDVADVAPNHEAALYPGHVRCKRVQRGHTCAWECAMRVYNDTYQDGRQNQPITLGKGSKLGFALAYCDNDHSPERENFMGSVPVVGEDKNQGYLNASIFGTLLLE